MKVANLPPISKADASAEPEADRLFTEPAPPPPYPAIELETMVTYEGYTFRVVFRDTSIAAAAEVLKKRGCVPAGAGLPSSPATNGHAPTDQAPPLCPSHNRPMKPMKFADKQGHTFMCTAKVGDGWCEERA